MGRAHDYLERILQTVDVRGFVYCAIAIHTEQSLKEMNLVDKTLSVLALQSGRRRSLEELPSEA